MLRRLNRLPSNGQPHAASQSCAETPRFCTVVVDFPSEIWAGIARCLASKQFAYLRQCTRSVFTESDEKLLWHHFCKLEGFAWPVALCQGSATSTSGDGPEVVWSQCFILNATAENGADAFACIRVRDQDIRIPIGIWDGNDSHVSATEAWLFNHGWRSKVVLGKALKRMLKPWDMPMRFRELISDRPGMICRRACVYTQASAASAAVEWPTGRDSTSGEYIWRLPPYCLEEALASEKWEDAPAVRSGPHPYGRGFGWLVELNLQDRDRECMGIPAEMAPCPRWIRVGRSLLASRLTVRDLCAELKVYLCIMGFDSSLEVMPSSQRDWVVEEKVTPELFLLSDLRWTQGERLHLKEVQVPRRLCQRWRHGMSEWQDGEAFKKVVLYQRETARPSIQRRGHRLDATLSALGWTSPPVRQVTSSSTSSANGFAGGMGWDSKWQRTETEESNWSQVSDMPLMAARSGGAQSSCQAAASASSSAEPRSSGSAGRGHSAEENKAPWSRGLLEAAACCVTPNWEEDLEHSELEVAQLSRAAANETIVGNGQVGSLPERWYRQATPGLDQGDPLQELLNAPDSFQELPHERRLVLSSSGARQFEFHPSRPDILLAGRKDGVIQVINHEADFVTHKLELDNYPILGLSWLHTNPQWAVCGVSQAGTVCLVNYNEDRPGPMEHVRLEPFSHLSSLSVNCTDEFFMTSGFCVDLGLYDLHTGRKLNTFRGVHQNFINIGRFAHRSPHIFATASFDHTCKLWDLREPVLPSKPVRLFKTESLNVMCCFSPDDKHILCSGVDDVLQQFNLAKDTSCHGSRFRLPAANSLTNYRRSLYLTNGDLVATAGTNESQVRICLAAYPHRHVGHIDFKGALRDRHLELSAATRSPQGMVEYNNTLFQRSMSRALVRLTSFSSSHLLAGMPIGRPLVQEEELHVETWPDRQQQEPRADAHRQVRSSASSGSEEYVQSLRSQPTDPMGLAALLSTSDTNPESFITMLKLGKGCRRGERPESLKQKTRMT
eukprot:TRINITY_DN14693_c0_g1_i2.p1 TRINITY_DN14693_c0_g1~~TRINITY_DN14693_c0_g1_i2.p1  ORF type:complete len:1009 (+),score=155.95 TRINITY_DN14693_c0_g1_i2:106-3132(+)